jgi:hypothetical protein
MEQNYNVITNLFIGITYLFSIILIIDELYNIGFFSFNYTYQFNYGSFTSKFNNFQTIECETSRFNVYNNINFLYKDIFNKSYFNYLLLIVATLITILCSIAYAAYFYFKFIIEQPLECSFTNETDLSFIKQILKCLCDECHKLIPNCTSNYFVVFVLLIIIPLSYIFKTLFNINFTPNSNNGLFQFIYICIFILLIFYYSFNLFNRKTEDKYKDLIVHSLFTIIFISSGYIYKYIYSKYNNINLNTSNDNTTIYDIYKQTPPIKPKPIQKPLYKGSDLISSFKYDENSKEPDYKIKKTIVDDYYKSIKNYDNDMKNYNIRYNAYNNSLTSTKLGDKTNYFDITIKILGLNNYMHIYLIILMIISLIIYNIYKDDISYVCFIYALTLLIALTIMNSILYYNTYINKYLIYEPMAHYKNDITNANTALNIELNPSSGLVFYNKLINNDKSSLTEINSGIKDGKEILEDIKKLKDISNYTYDNASNINKDITNYNSSGLNFLLYSNYNKISDAIFYYRKAPNAAWIAESENDPISYLIYDCTSKIYCTNNMKIETNKKLTFKYNNINIITTIPMTGYYKYNYHIAYQYKFILKSLIQQYKNDKFLELINLNNILDNILSVLDPYKGEFNENTKTIIENQLTGNVITSLNKRNNTYQFSDRFNSIKNNINEINDSIFKNINTIILKNSLILIPPFKYINIIDITTTDTERGDSEDVNVIKNNKVLSIKTDKFTAIASSISSINTAYIKQVSLYNSAASAAALLNKIISPEHNDAVKKDSTLTLVDPYIIDIVHEYNIKTAEKVLNTSKDTVPNAIAAFTDAINGYAYTNTIITTYFNSYIYNYNNYKITYNKDYENIKYSNPTLDDAAAEDAYKFYELPNNIIDDNNNEYYLKLGPAKISVYIKYINDDFKNSDTYQLYYIKSKYETLEEIQAKSSGLHINYYSKYNIIKINNEAAIPINNSIPFIFYKNNNSKINALKTIVNAVLLNSVVNIQYKFTSPDFLIKIKNQKTIIVDSAPTYKPPDTYFTDTSKQININYMNNDAIITNTLLDTGKYISNSTELFKKPAVSPNTNIFVLIILALNIYNISRKDIKNIINENILYIIKVYKKIQNISIIKICDKLNEENKDTDDYEDNEIKELYKINNSTISLILLLFENLFSLLLKELKSTISTLCFSSTEPLSTIESALNTYSSINNANGAADNTYSTLTANKPTTAATIENNFILRINEHIRYYFNIVIFLLDNLKLNTNTAEIDMITTNYNFYNRDDNIKNIIQKQLIINCDYYSKYNNMDSKQLSYFKINADNVNYNFPILMIIFLIILGEPIFIKS